MIFKLKKNKSLHLAHAESGYLCCFKTNLNPATTEANNIVPFAKKATGKVVEETVEQTAIQAGAKAGAGKLLGPVGLAYDVLGNAEPTAIGTFGTTAENTFNFANNPAETLTMALNSAGELRLKLGNVFLPGQYPLINLARDVNIGFDGETYTLYNRGETIKLALGDGIKKKGDVLEIQIDGETTEIKMPVRHNPNQVSRTKLANGGETATPSLERQQQKTEKQEATDNLNKANTRTRASLGSDFNNLDVNENKDILEILASSDRAKEVLDLLIEKKVDLNNFQNILISCAEHGQAERILDLLIEKKVDMKDFQKLASTCAIYGQENKVLHLLESQILTTEDVYEFLDLLEDLMVDGSGKETLKFLIEKQFDLSDIKYLGLFSYCGKHSQAGEIVGLLIEKQVNFNNLNYQILLKTFIDKGETKKILEVFVNHKIQPKNDLAQFDDIFLFAVLHGQEEAEQVFDFISKTNSFSQFPNTLSTIATYPELSRKVLDLVLKNKNQINNNFSETLLKILKSCCNNSSPKEALDFINNHSNLLTENDLSDFNNFIKPYENRQKVEKLENFAKETLGLYNAEYNTSNVSTIALVNLAVMQLKERGIDLSQIELIVEPLFQVGLKGYLDNSKSYEKGRAILYLDDEKIGSDESNWSSTNNFYSHTVFHEIAHGLDFLNNKTRFKELNNSTVEDNASLLQRFGLSTGEVKELLSEYPITTGSHTMNEIKAEMFASAMATELFGSEHFPPITDERLWKLYDYLGGPEIPTRKTQNTQPPAQKQKD